MGVIHLKKIRPTEKNLREPIEAFRESVNAHSLQSSDPQQRLDQ